MKLRIIQANMMSEFRHNSQQTLSFCNIQFNYNEFSLHWKELLRLLPMSNTISKKQLNPWPSLTTFILKKTPVFSNKECQSQIWK